MSPALVGQEEHEACLQALAKLQEQRENTTLVHHMPPVRRWNWRTWRFELYQCTYFLTATGRFMVHGRWL
jgi:hypothetical protein